MDKGRKSFKTPLFFGKGLDKKTDWKERIYAIYYMKISNRMENPTLLGFVPQPKLGWIIWTTNGWYRESAKNWL